MPATSFVAVFPPELQQRIERAWSRAAEALRQERGAASIWTGELSASALSTATAIVALTLAGRGRTGTENGFNDYVTHGCAWLAANQNPDGGWGDTTVSISNISTTMLVWAALGLCGGGRPSLQASGSRAERWLEQAAGSLQPRNLVDAIERCYGDDKTFSIPILTMCALCGRLGPENEAWSRVRQLPFEIAALPQRWFGALRLPVVSYALPALIAIGQVRHAKRPTRNPVARAIRDRCRQRTLRKLLEVQPENGGFLEATPLTSFVTMSLAACGLAEHQVVQRGVEFLKASMRRDGSWPIDTNLATWVTTLAVNALTAGSHSTYGKTAGEAVPLHDGITSREAGLLRSGRASLSSADLTASESREISRWLRQQQHRIEHPYTLAAPGGWAWTDLPGGVPDADDTAGAILALLGLEGGTHQVTEAARAGVSWLLDLQNSDGGVPTFCRGWGKLPFDQSSPDITAHAMRAWAAVREGLPRETRHRVDRAQIRAIQFLIRSQRADGAWVPLWFGHQENPTQQNPLYGTARVVLALCRFAAEATPDRDINWALTRAVDWLTSAQNADGGWSGTVNTTSSVEETGLALEALAELWSSGVVPVRADLANSLCRGGIWLCEAVEQSRWQKPVPIGLYFAKLWYHEKLYPLIFATAGLGRLRRVVCS